MSKIVNEEMVKIESAAVAYLTAFNRADIPAVIETYTNDGVLMGPGRPASAGKEELKQAYGSVFETIGFSMKYQIKEVEQIGPLLPITELTVIMPYEILAEKPHRELFYALFIMLTVCNSGGAPIPARIFQHFLHFQRCIPLCCYLQREFFFFQESLAINAARATQAPHNSWRLTFTSSLAWDKKNSGTINTVLAKKPHSAALFLSLPVIFRSVRNPKNIRKILFIKPLKIITRTDFFVEH